jgi:hypothetical protein
MLFAVTDRKTHGNHQRRKPEPWPRLKTCTLESKSRMLPTQKVLSQPAGDKFEPSANKPQSRLCCEQWEGVLGACGRDSEDKQQVLALVTHSNVKTSK